MSEGNKIQVEFGGSVDPSFDSSSEHIRKGLEENKAAHEKATATIVASLASVASAYITHQAKIGAIRAAWTLASAVARQGLETLAAKGITTGVSLAESLVRALPVLGRISGGLGVATAGMYVLSKAMAVVRAASDEVQVGLEQFKANEDLVSQLKPLTGSLDSAKAKLRDLADTFRGTKIELPDAIDTFRSTQVQTGGALSDKKGLTMLGDVAAASGNSLKDTGDAVGKFYGDLQAGAPIDESVKKLRDMGIVSAEVTQHIYAMQSAGQSGAEVWAYLTGQLQKSSGAMLAAADDLSTLQKAATDAKNKLHELFAEASAGGKTANGDDDGAKGELKQQIALYKALEPVAQEAGLAFASFSNILSGAVKYWTGNTEAAKANAEGNKEASRSLLAHVGNLKLWTGAAATAGVAIAALALAAIPYGIAAGAAGVATLVGATAFAGLAAAAAAVILPVGLATAAIVSIGYAIGLWADNCVVADKALADLITSNRAMLTSLHQQELGIKSVTDKILFLAKAYQELDAIQQKIREAKDPRQKEELERAKQRIQNDIKRAERRDDTTLEAPEARKKVEKETKDKQDEVDDLLKNPQDKYDDAMESMVDAFQKENELIGKLRDAEDAAKPGGAASDEVIDKQIRDARSRIKESKARLKHDGFEDGIYPDEDAEKQSQSEDEQKVRDLEAFRRGREQRIETARANLSTQHAVVVDASKDLVTTQKAAEEYQAKARALEIEKQIAALETEGIERTREEWRLKREGLEADRIVADRGPDKNKVGEIDVKIAQGDAAQKKQEEENANRLRGLEEERAILGLKSEGVQRASEEWAIRLKGLQTELAQAESHHDGTKVAEITGKIVEGNTKLGKTVEADAVSSREIEDEAKIALLQSEGIQRAREESTIRLGMIEKRWSAAKDEKTREQERLAYIKEQAAIQEKERQNTLELGHDQRALDEARASRQDAAAKREIERQFKEGKIDGATRRQQEAAILEGERQRLHEDANTKIREAAEAERNGDKTKATQLDREAVELRSRADAIAGQQYDLLNPQSHGPVVSELQKIGGGGRSLGGSNQNPLEKKTDELIREQKQTNALLKEQGRKTNQGRVL